MNRHQIPAHLRTGSEESAVTTEIFRWGGGIVFNTSQPRGSILTPGIPDKLVMFVGRRILLGWDDKTGSERYPPTDQRRLSPDQKVFRDFFLLPLTTDFGFGDAEAAKAYLMRGKT